MKKDDMNTVIELLATATLEDLNDISSMIRQRREYLQTQAAMRLKLNLKAGDRATLHGLKPKYLNGCRVTILSVTGMKAQVAFDINPNPKRFGHEVGVPLACITPI